MIARRQRLAEGFPYASGPLSVDTVDFDPTNGGAYFSAGSTTDITITGAKWCIAHGRHRRDPVS